MKISIQNLNIHVHVFKMEIISLEGFVMCLQALYIYIWNKPWFSTHQMESFFI